MKSPSIGVDIQGADSDVQVSDAPKAPISMYAFNAFYSFVSWTTCLTSCMQMMILQGIISYI